MVDNIIIIVINLGLTAIVSTISSILAYKRAVKKMDKEIEAVKINADTEIKKIQEEANKTVLEIESKCENEIKKNM